MADTSLADTNASGIYQIRNLINGNLYIGSAVSFVRRWRQHRCELAKGRHNPHMQNAWKKYGECGFIFEVLEVVEEIESLIAREQHYLDLLCPEYNVAVKAGSNLGNKFGPEFGKRVSEQNRIRWADPAYRLKQSEAHKGYKPSAEHRRKISESNKGRKLSEAHLAKFREASDLRAKSEAGRKAFSDRWKGIKKTPEQIAKMVASKLGKPAHNRGKPMSEEQKAKQSEKMLARFRDDPGLREKISQRTKVAMNRPDVAEKVRRANEARRGKSQSLETIQKRSKSLRAAWARRKGKIACEQQSDNRHSDQVF